jgi:hypothetical protein
MYPFNISIHLAAGPPKTFVFSFSFRDGQVLVAQFLPALLCPCTRRGRVRQIISSAKLFQRGDLKGSCETACVWGGEKLTPMLA